MTASSGIIEQLAARYALDLHDPDVSPEKVEEALLWIERSPANRHAFERAQRFLELCDDNPYAFAAGHGPTEEKAKLRDWPATRFLIAASLLIALLGGILVASLQVWRGSGSEGKEIPGKIAFHEDYRTAIGQNRRIVLRDGSVIFLGGASRISVDFDKRERGVELLAGEALFSVTKDADRPWVLQSGKAVVTVHGTLFNVKREPDSSEITLLEGLVDVRPRGKSEQARKLLPEMQISVADNGRMSAPQRVDVHKVTGWREGILHFNESPLAAVVADLNRYSARQVVIDSRQIEAVKVSGSVRLDSIDDWIDGLSSAFNIDVIRSDPDRIVIRSKS